MELEADFYKTAKQSNIKSLQYAFRDRKNKKDHLDLYGFQESMLHQEIMGFIF